MKKMAGLVKVSHVLLIGLVLGVAASAVYAQYQRDPPQQQWGGYDGGNWEELQKQRQEVLKKIPVDPDVLVNVTYELMPSTPELTALGRKATRALTRGLLDNADDNVRALCATVLWQIRDPEATPAVVEALKDRYEMVRQRGALALGDLADPKYGSHLLAMVQDPEESDWVKQTAIESLGKLGYVKAVPALTKMVQDYGDTGALQALWHMRNKADRDDLVDLFTWLVEKGRPGANQVIDYLGELKADGAADALAKFYVGKDEYTKNRIILAMGKIGNGKAKTFLKGVMKSTQVARHLNNAGIALSRLGEKAAAVEILIGLLSDRKAYMRVNAAFALGEIEATEKVAVDGLLKALKDQNDYVRSEACVALGRLKAAAAVPALKELAESPNPFVQLDAVIALNRIDYQAHRQLIFDKLLSHQEPEHRRIVERGVRFLAEQKDAAAIPYMLQYMRSPYGINYSAVLGMLEGYEPGMVRDLDNSLLYQAHVCGYYDCLGPLLRLLRHWKLSAFAPALIERLFRTYYEADKTALYYTLGKIAPRETLATLAGIEERNPTVKLYQIFAMANLGDEKSLNHLIDMVRDGTLEDKRDAAFLLAGLDSDAANAQLEKLMETADPFTAVAAAAALVGHGHKKAYEFLLYTMKEGTPVVADEAERALLVSQEKTIDEFLNSAIGKEKDVILKNRMQEILYKRAPNRDFR